MFPSLIYKEKKVDIPLNTMNINPDENTIYNAYIMCVKPGHLDTMHISMFHQYYVALNFTTTGAWHPSSSLLDPVLGEGVEELLF